MVVRAVQKNVFSSKFSPTAFISWSMGSIEPKKNFSTKLVHLTPPPSHALFLDFLIQAKYWKIGFWAWSFYFIYLKCIFSNINCRKAFCLMWVSNFYDHTQPDFRPHPLLVILIQLNWRKIDFLLWCFHFICLECILSNINCRKAFCLMWVSNFYDHTQPDFRPHPLLVILIQLNWRKIDFLLWCFHFICLECILSNINCRKAFCLFWVWIAYDHTQPDFQPRPFLQVKSLRFLESQN